MNNKLKIVNIILLTIIFVLFISFYTNINDFNILKLGLATILILILLINTIVELKRKNEILESKKYNIILLISNIITFVIFFRNMFDNKIPVNSTNEILMYTKDELFKKSGTMFIDYNMIFIIIMFGGLLFYNLINKNKKYNNSNQNS